VGAVVSKPDKLEGEDEMMYRERRAFEGRNEIEAILTARDHAAYRNLGVEDQRDVLEDVIQGVRRKLRKGGVVPQSWNAEVARVISSVRERRRRN
jgi:hypothetical protein